MRSGGPISQRHRAPGRGTADRCWSYREIPSTAAPIGTIVSVPLTSTLRWADAPGNVRLTARSTGLPRDSVANVSQIVTVDRSILTERVGKLARSKVDLILSGIDIVLGRG